MFVVFFLYYRHGLVKDWLKKIEELEGGLEEFTQGYKYYGFHVLKDNTIVAREWAPGKLSEFIRIYSIGSLYEPKVLRYLLLYHES